MLLILPAGAFLFFLLLLREHGIDWRRSALAAAVFWGACVALSTEALSAPFLLSRGPVAAFWLAACIASAIYWTILKRRPPHRSPPKESSDEVLPSAVRKLLVAAGAAVFLVGIDAVVAPPSTWDAMLYHLPRVTMWISNHSIRFYPTPDLCQLIYAPWAEYAMLHTCLPSVFRWWRRGWEPASEARHSLLWSAQRYRRGCLKLRGP